MASPQSARVWSDYRLFKHEFGRKQFFHDSICELTLNYDTLPVPDTDGQILCAYTTDPGSPSEEKLSLLLSWSDLTASR